MARTPERGDTPHLEDKPSLVDTAAEPDVKRRGDTPRTDPEPALVEVPEGRAVDPKAPRGDTPRTDPEPALVENYGRDLNGPSPNEVAEQRASKAKAKKE